MIMARNVSHNMAVFPFCVFVQLKFLVLNPTLNTLKQPIVNFRDIIIKKVKVHSGQKRNSMPVLVVMAEYAKP